MTDGQAQTDEHVRLLIERNGIERHAQAELRQVARGSSGREVPRATARERSVSFFAPGLYLAT